MSRQNARVPYKKRPAPTQYSQAWLDIEHGNLQRAIPVQTVKTVKSDYTATSLDFTIRADATDGPITITLPPPEQVEWLYLNIKKIDSSGNTVTIAGTVDGVVNPTLTAQYDSITVQSNGLSYDKLGSV